MIILFNDMTYLSLEVWLFFLKFCNIVQVVVMSKETIFIAYSFGINLLLKRLMKRHMRDCDVELLKVHG